MEECKGSGREEFWSRSITFHLNTPLPKYVPQKGPEAALFSEALKAIRGGPPVSLKSSEKATVSVEKRQATFYSTA